jgi:hypothetical protein
MTLKIQTLLHLLVWCLISSFLPSLLLAFTDQNDGAFAYDVIVIGYVMRDLSCSCDKGGSVIETLTIFVPFTETIERELGAVRWHRLW